MNLSTDSLDCKACGCGSFWERAAVQSSGASCPSKPAAKSLVKILGQIYEGPNYVLWSMHSVFPPPLNAGLGERVAGSHQDNSLSGWRMERVGVCASN